MLRFISYVLVFIVGFGVCAGIYYAAPPRNQVTSGRMTAMAEASSGGPAVGAGPGTTIFAVAKLEPSVVNIDITGKPIVVPNNQFDFQFPFGFPGMGEGMRAPEEQTPKGQASGVIISSDGYILTNNHVAGDASKLVVTLHDGRRLNAKVIGKDEHSDLAVIKVDASGLPHATQGNSTDVKLGQWVIAVGNPLGIGSTATAGIISAIRSPFTLKNHIFPELIQTDAAINPGNSGGALADLNGDVIGINTAIASTNGGSIGIGFAIPINMAMKHAEEMIHTGSVTYPWLGIGYSAQTPGQPLPVKGVVLARVDPDGPAAKAHLQAGDIITQINNHPIDQPERINYLILQHEPGETITIQYWRNGQTHTVEVTLSRLPARLEAPPAPPAPPIP